MAEKFRKMMLSGQPIKGLDIIDAHNHLGPYFNLTVYRGGTIESMIERMDTIGVRKISIAANAAIGPDVTMGNDETEDAITRFPDRAMGYVTIKPCPEEEMERELNRFRHPGFIGIKLHPGLHGVNVAHDSYRPAMEYADRHHLPVLIHTWSHGDVSDLSKLAAQYKSAFFLLAHMGGSPDVLNHAIDTLIAHDNVFGDTALSYAPHRGIEYIVRRAGAEKLLFGSDMPFYDPVFTLARVVSADIHESEIEKIAGGNFKIICPKAAE